MRFSRRYGKYCPGLYFIGIVFDGDTLLAEFGPQKFQSKTDNFLSTSRFTLHELHKVLMHDYLIPFMPNEKKNYLRQIDKAFNHMTKAIVGLHKRQVDFFDFPAPEEPVDVTRYADMADNDLQIVFGFANHLAHLRGKPTVQISAGAQKIVDEFMTIARRGFGLDGTQLRKPLPTALLPKAV